MHMTSETMVCPECGRPMALRTARRGRYAGRQFWGCTGYSASPPNQCKAIVNIPDEGFESSPAIGASSSTAQADDSTGSTTSGSSPRGVEPDLNPETIPRQVSVQPNHTQEQVRFFQACGLPAEYVNAIYQGETERELVRSAAQWRLDYPLPRTNLRDPWLLQQLSIAESILTRGATPFCSPEIEKALRNAFPNASAGSGFDSDLKTITRGPGACSPNAPFGSDEEKQFVEILKSWPETADGGWHVIPQIHLSALVPDADAASAERGDFLLTSTDSSPILVEIDGEDHDEHQDRDDARDNSLRLVGVEVHRLPASEIRATEGPKISYLRSALAKPAEAVQENDAVTLLLTAKLAHQIQIVLLEGLRGGWITLGERWNVGVVLPKSLVGVSGMEHLVALAGDELSALLVQLSHLYDVSISLSTPQVTILTEGDAGNFDLIVSGADIEAGEVVSMTSPVFRLSNTLFPAEIMVPLSSTAPAVIESPSRDAALWFLNYLFRKNDFWEGQWEAVRRTLRGEDSVVLLPTGGGKSMVFQLTSLLLPGRCLIVEPTIALMSDQVDNLSKVGIDRCAAISSRLRTFTERETVVRTFAAGHYLFTYVAPERLQTVQFRDALRELTVGIPVSVIVVDEAHCVSEWGHDFRTAYLNVGRISREYGASSAMIPPIVAMTGTASRIVLKDVQRELGITAFDAIITPDSFDRPELRYSVLRCHSDEKSRRVQGLLTRFPSDFNVAHSTFFDSQRGEEAFSGLVFCPHVNGDFGVVRQAEQIGGELGLPVGVYSGGPPRGYNAKTWDDQKQQVERDFKRNHTNILVCTSAFGMGIDKPNIRFTVHTTLPPSIESFYQEAGRAGRDRHEAQCAIVVSDDDPERSRYLLAPGTPVEELARVVDSTNRYDADDILRTLYFYVGAFRGRNVEIDDLDEIIRSIGDLSQRRQIPSLSWRQQSGRDLVSRERAVKAQMEKALHRLVVIGVVDDYTVDFSAKEFSVRLAGATQDQTVQALEQYVGAYQARLGEQIRVAATSLRQPDHGQFVKGVCRLLVEFVYEHLELGRRAAIREMYDATGVSADGEALRGRILAHLERSEYDDRLDTLVASPVGGLDELAYFTDEIVSPNHAAALRGAVARFLESYPDVPGLLLLRGLAEVLAADSQPNVVVENIRAALGFGQNQFGLESELLGEALGRIASIAARRSGAAEQILAAALSNQTTDRGFARELVRQLPPKYAALPALWLTHELTEKIGDTIF